MDEQRTPDPQAAGAAVPAAARGRLRVAEHVGQAAGDAAQAIRRAGLRPALERSFDHPGRPVGQVVAQEPAAGAELPRGALVTIYVAARSVEHVEGQPDAKQPDEHEPEQDAAAEAEAAFADDTLVEDLQIAAEHELALATPDELAEAQRVEQDDPRDAGQGDQRAAPEAIAAPRVDGDADGWQKPDAAGTVEVDAISEAVLRRAEELFAERFAERRAARDRWRRPHWRSPSVSRVRGSVRSRLGDRRWLVRSACAALGLWLLVGIVAAVIGGSHGTRARHDAHGSPHRAAAATPAQARAQARQQAKPPRQPREAGGTSDGAGGGGAPRRPARVRHRRADARRRGAIRRPAKRAPSPTVATPAAPADRRSVAPTRQSAPTVVSEPAPAPEAPPEPAPVEAAREQVGGGPFSP